MEKRTKIGKSESRKEEEEERQTESFTVDLLIGNRTREVEVIDFFVLFLHLWQHSGTASWRGSGSGSCHCCNSMSYFDLRERERERERERGLWVKCKRLNPRQS